MSITPGWIEKTFDGFTPGYPVTFSITQDGKKYYLDNGQEYREYPETKAGWMDLCDDLKDFTP